MFEPFTLPYGALIAVALLTSAGASTPRTAGSATCAQAAGHRLGAPAAAARTATPAAPAKCPPQRDR